MNFLKNRVGKYSQVDYKIECHQVNVSLSQFVPFLWIRHVISEQEEALREDQNDHLVKDLSEIVESVSHGPDGHVEVNQNG